MRAKKPVQTIIGSAGFILEDITVNPEMNEINIAVRPTEHEQCRCGICHRKAARYDKGRGRRRWRAYILRQTSRGYAAGNMAW